MLKASPELRQCADAHEQECITNDSYGIKELSQRDSNIEYVVDIGGNIGAFSRQILNFFPNAKIMLCEPEPELMKYAKENTDNKLIYVQKAIVGDHTLKEVKFIVCKWQGNHHVEGRFNWDNYTPAGSEKIGEIVVEADTLMHLIRLENFTRVDLLKIDTEGAEPEILKDIKPWLKNVRHLAIEWHSQKDLVQIKEFLMDTHNLVITEGAFKEPSGAVANGNIVAELKTQGEGYTQPKLIKNQIDVTTLFKTVPAKGVCCGGTPVFENNNWYCGTCKRLIVT